MEREEEEGKRGRVVLLILAMVVAGSETKER